MSTSFFNISILIKTPLACFCGAGADRITVLAPGYVVIICLCIWCYGPAMHQYATIDYIFLFQNARFPMGVSRIVSGGTCFRYAISVSSIT